MIRGVTHFHSETGTEGGYWAVQDEKFMGIANFDKTCTQCGRIWQESKDEPDPRTSRQFTYWVNREDGGGNYMGYDEPQDLPTTPGEPGDFNDVWTKERNAASRVCYDAGKHLGWKLMYPQGMWSYEGLHVLKNGDHLRIFDRDNPSDVIWEGDIELDSVGLFSETAYNMWIHADQRGQDREAWADLFMKEHPCELTNVESRAKEKTE